MTNPNCCRLVFQALGAPAAACAVLLLAMPTGAAAQVASKPPQAQAWIDVATYSGMSMPSGGGMAGNPMSLFGSLLGGDGAVGANSFGNTRVGLGGRWVDVTVTTRNNPSLTEAAQDVPAGFLPSRLTLQAPKEAREKVPDNDEAVVDAAVERPRGKLLMYWGCGDTVRAGQPKVLDMVSASAADLARFFVSRRATQRGAHSQAGRPVWPSRDDTRMLPAGASLVGEHAFSGEGVPDGFRFRIASSQDLMPPLDLKTRPADGRVELSWFGAPTARAFFAAGLASGGNDEMVLWTSSELPDTGFGLTDYQTNAAVDRWLKEKVLLSPATTRCTVPKGVFGGEGAMLKLIGYGNESTFAQPPRPADPKVAWEPVWTAKVRVKSVATAIVGMPEMPSASSGAEAPTLAAEPAEKKPGAIDILRGVFGR